ncbi:MAG: hypothetical protein H6719_36520 [Sandaracinaceae bacterium]|nr:hypothetical protein [Sandaracinaceae bacterium]
MNIRHGSDQVNPTTSPPEPSFDPAEWIAWPDLENVAADAQHPIHRLGAYVIGRFDERPTQAATGYEGEGPLARTGVIYIGETHGRTSSLLSRLKQFGNSAGIFGPPQDGHYAAWGLRPALEIEDRRSALPEAEVSRLYVALCPLPPAIQADTERRDARGVLPGLFEARLLWSFVQQRGHLPLLNSSGDHGAADLAARADAVVASLDQAAVTELIAASEVAKTQAVAADILTKIMAAWSYTDRPIRSRVDDRGDIHACRPLGGGTWIFVGHSTEGAYVSLWAGDVCDFGPEDASAQHAAARDPASFANLVRALVKFWA